MRSAPRASAATGLRLLAREGVNIENDLHVPDQELLRDRPRPRMHPSQALHGAFELSCEGTLLKKLQAKREL